MEPHWRRNLPDPCPDQVANKKDSLVDLSPVSEVPALAVKAGWDAWRLGLEPPLIWERVLEEEDECQTL